LHQCAAHALSRNVPREFDFQGVSIQRLLKPFPTVQQLAFSVINV
jgi:hypothetical protein